MSQPQSPTQTPDSTGAPRLGRASRIRPAVVDVGAVACAIIWAVVGRCSSLPRSPRSARSTATSTARAAFVGAYLDALQAKDAAGALALPGVALSDEDARRREPAREQLERAAASRRPARARRDRPVDDVDQGDGLHTVTYSYDEQRHLGETTFSVKSAGTRFPLFPTWRSR